MPIPQGSFLFNESAEPSTSPLPLEARRIHFCIDPYFQPGPDSDGVRTGRWIISHDDGAGHPVNSEFAFRHDMIHGGHRAKTNGEVEVDGLVRGIVERERTLERWWPRTESYRGVDKCFDIIFLRPNSFGCTIDGAPACAPARDKEAMSVRFIREPLPVGRRARAREQHRRALAQEVPSVAPSNEPTRSGDEAHL